MCVRGPVPRSRLEHETVDEAKFKKLHGFAVSKPDTSQPMAVVEAIAANEAQLAASQPPPTSVTGPLFASATAPLSHAEEEEEEDAGGAGGVASVAGLGSSMLRRQDDDGSGMDLSHSMFLHLFEKQVIPGVTNNIILLEQDWEKTLSRDAGKTVAQRRYLEDYEGSTSLIPASLNAHERLMIKFDVNNTKFKHPPDVLRTALSDGVRAEVLLGFVYRRGSSWTVARVGHVHEATVLELNNADSVFLVGGGCCACTISSQTARSSPWSPS